MKKVRIEQINVLRGMSTLPISKSQDPEPAGIGAQLRKKEKRILTSLKCKLAAKKTTLSILALLVSFSTFIQFLPQAHPASISAEADTTYVMDVDLNEYALNTQDSIYYAWRGKVNLTGQIAVSEVSSASIVAYLDNMLTPVFNVSVLPADITDNKYSFSTQVDTTKHTKGYHTLRFFNGTVTSFGEKEPILTIPVYFEYPEIATIANVTTDCNMRTTATTESAILVAVPLGATVKVLGQVVGQNRPEYGTNVWNHVVYEKNTSIYTGYILSTFIKKMTTGISMMKVTASDAVIDPFLAGKTTYELNLPYSAYDLSVADLVMYNQDDTLEVNGMKVDDVDFTHNTISLTPGPNTVVFKTISAFDGTSMTYTYNIWRIAESTEAEFQAQLAQFPESYKPALRALHSKYPDWLFTPFHTGLDWATVVTMQGRGETSLIGLYTKPEYKENDVPVEPNFVLASKAAIEYYLDPRNFFSERQIFQFELLSYNAAMHSLAGIQRILQNSGLAGMESMFHKAGVDSKVSPFHLAARSRQEVTVWPNGLSSIATGTYSGGGGIYLGHYNFYNIGTGANISHDVVIQNGLKFAMQTIPEYDLPWNSQEKAIVGGGKYIGKNYINAGQDTLYLQKFDVDDRFFGMHWHQYMQNIQAPESEASSTYNAYVQIGMLANSFIFRIPVYQNMPLLTSPKPEDTNKLNTLSVSGYALTPAFDTGSDVVYRATVPSTADKVTLTASTLNSSASITGTGEKALVFGDANTFIVSSSPANGVKRDYTVQVTRELPDRSADNYLSSASIVGAGPVAISPGFNPDLAGPYTASVPTGTEQVTLSAIPQNAAATIVSGTGTPHSLVLGMNEVSIVVRAENGTTRTYAFQIMRTIPRAASTSYTFNNGTITGIPISTTVDGLKSRIDSSIATMRLFDASGNECAGNTVLGTGMTLRVYYGSTLLEENAIVIYGDINGDGKINSTDITTLKRYILKLSPITGRFLDACDVNKDGKYNSTDYTIIRRHILKLQDISQN